MRKLLLALAWLLPCWLQAQQIGEWKLYRSYSQATQNIVAGHTVYSLCDGNLLAYNTDDTEVRTYDSQHHLNGVRITHMAYSSEAARLILVYDDGNIDLLDADDRVVNLSALRDKTLPNKEVKHVCTDGHMAYIVTGFGLVEVDMQEGTFGNTYQLDLKILSVAFSPETIFLSTATGLYSCPRTANMQQKNNWTQLDNVTWQGLAWHGGALYGLTWGAVFRINLAGGYNSRVANNGAQTLKTSGDYLLWFNANSLSFCTSTADVTTLSLPNTWNDVSHAGGIFWASQGEDGLIGYRTDGSELTKVAGPIKPNSPKHDLCYRMQWLGDRLLVAGGINTISGIFNPATAMYYEDGVWTNFQEMDIPEAYPHLNLSNTTHLVEDPSDPTHHFASLHRVGLCEYRDGAFVRLYNCDNSPLRSIVPDEKEGRYYNYVSCAGLTYDADGNLWMLNSETDTIVRFRRPNGRWGSLYYDELRGVSLCDDYLMHSSGLIFLNSRRMTNRGFFCFDTRGTLDNVRDDRHRLHTTITNQDGTSYSPNEFYCMTEDLDGRIWCGTSQGIFVINDAEDFLDEDFQFEQVKIARNDGSGLADYLLNGVSVSCIAVDGANRKWVGTLDNGLYLISADGTEMIHHFMKADSPLTSDNIFALAVHPTTGLVMIACENGLCSYMAEATEGAEKLSADDVVVYPNPVSPDYTGPIAVRGLVRDSEVKILSSSGQLVWKGTSAGGTFTWNGCNNRGRRVASGVYHIVANDAQGNKAIVARIVMIK